MTGGLLRRALTAAAGMAVLLAAAPAAAQPPGESDRDTARLALQLRIGDRAVVHVDDGASISGRVEAVADRAITLRAGDERRTIPTDRVVRVERLRNGVLLGALVGAAAGVPFGIALKSYAYNEGGNEAAAVLFPIGVGLGAGLAIDALLVRPRTVFERAPSAASVSIGLLRRGGVARVSLKF